MTDFNDMCIHCIGGTECEIDYTECDGTGCIDYECFDNEIK